jgi:hypothetical protein
MPQLRNEYVYAKRTRISPERTRLDIETLMRKRGADQFFSGADSDRAILAFRVQGRHIRFVLPIGGQLNEQQIRTRWRALWLVVKARLEAIEVGITTLEEAFLAETVLPDKKTVAETMLPQIEDAYRDGRMPPLLPHYPEDR